MYAQDPRQLDAYLLCLETSLNSLKAKYRTKPAKECLSEVQVMQTCLEDVAALLRGSAPIEDTQRTTNTGMLYSRHLLDTRKIPPRT